RDSHREQCRNERRLAPDTIAEMAEQRGADGPGEERERERRERLQRRRRRVARGKKQLREYEYGGRAVDVEVEVFDRRADEARDENATFRHWRRALAAMLVGVSCAAAALRASRA